MAELPAYKISEKDKIADDAKWYKSWAKYIAGAYNSQYPKRDNDASNGLSTTVVGNTSFGNAANSFGNTPIGQIQKYYLYYRGEQPNLDYGWSERDASQTPYGPTWIRGKKIQQLVDDSCGKADKILQNMKVSTRALSEAASNKRTEALEKWRFFNAIKPVIDQLGLKQMGIEFSPLGGAEEDFDLPEQVYEYLEDNYQQEIEKYAKIIADDFNKRNYASTYFLKVFKDAVIGGISATEFYAKGNRVWTRGYEGDAIIWDNSKDDPLNKDCNYIGLIRYMTPSEILDTWTEKQLGKESYKKITKIAEKPSYATVENIPNLPDSSLSGFMNTNAGLMIPVIVTYWRALKDTRYTESEPDKYGNKHIVKKKDAEEGDGDYWVETWYTTTLISSLACVDYGQCYNNVQRLTDKRRIEPPVKIFMPNITRGGLSSLVGKLYQHQDRKDFLMNEITKYIDKAYGRVLVINGQKLGDTKFSAVVEDFKRYGVSVVNTNASGDEEDPNAARPLMEAYDMTLDPNMQMYLELMREEDKIMQQIAGTSEVALGQQQGYISANSQQATIGQNSHQTFSLYTSFIEFISMVIGHAVNMQKNMLAGALTEEDKRIPLIGDEGIRYLKEIEDFGLEDFGIYIKIDDPIDEVGRSEIMKLALMWSENPAYGVMPPDVLKVANARTFSEATRILEIAFARNKREQAKAAQQQQMMQQIEQAKMMQEAAQLEQFKQQNENDRTVAKNETKLEDTRMKVEGSMANQLLSSQLPRQGAQA